MNDKFVKQATTGRKALITPELEELEKAIYKLVDKTDGGFGAFVYKGQLWTMFPPDNPEHAYHLIAAQVACLSQAYEKSPTVIMAEVNGAIKDVMK